MNMLGKCYQIERRLSICLRFDCYLFLPVNSELCECRNCVSFVVHQYTCSIWHGTWCLVGLQWFNNSWLSVETALLEESCIIYSIVLAFQTSLTFIHSFIRLSTCSETSVPSTGLELICSSKWHTLVTTLLAHQLAVDDFLGLPLWIYLVLLSSAPLNSHILWKTPSFLCSSSLLLLSA